MRFYGLFVAVLTCIAIVQPICAADKDAPAKTSKNYAESAEECEKAIEQRKRELANQYSTDVQMLKEKFQKAGDLEKALITDEEWSRSLARKPLTQEQLVESLPELVNLQREYISLFTTVAETVATEFLHDLKKEASELAKAGKLADGKVLQQEIDTIRRLYLGGSDKMPHIDGKAATKTEGDVIAACEEAIRQKRVALQAQYVSELEAMEKSFQAKGALEDLFAAKAERKRFIQTPVIVEENLMETPDALRELQQKHLELQRNLTACVVEECITRLEQQKQALTIEGRLDEAVQLKADAEKIRQRYLDAAKSMVCPGLGKKCNYFYGDWSGKWVRRGSSNIFDCTMFHGPARETATYVATLEVKGGDVVVRRTEYKSTKFGVRPPEQFDEYVWHFGKDGKSLYENDPTYSVLVRAE